jgi:hypothetical protein
MKLKIYYTALAVLTLTISAFPPYDFGTIVISGAGLAMLLLAKTIK